MAQEIKLLLVSEEKTEERPDSLFFSDSLSLDTYLLDWRDQQRARAYWEASVDSLLRLDSLHYVAFLYRGPAYRWGNIKPAEDIPKTWLQRAGFRPRAFRDRPLDHGEWLAVRDSLVVSAAADGYPFAEAGLDSIRWIARGVIKANLWLKKGPLIRFGVPEVPESARIDGELLGRLLGLEEGGLYNQRLLRSLPDRLAQLPYVRLVGTPTVAFRGREAIVRLPLERKAASRFDFVVGVLPNSNQTGRLLITGDLNGELVNGLGQGERIAVNFEQLRPQTQELQLAFDYPYLLGLPFGLETFGELYRRDTQFINLSYRVGATYRWKGNNQLNAYWQRRQTNLLGFDAERVSRTMQLPDTLDVNRTFFGVDVIRRTVDQAFNPRRGYVLSIGIAAGTRRVRRNGKLLDLGLGFRYDSLEERSGQYQFHFSGEFYRPFLAGTVFFMGAKAAGTFGNERLLANEQYRLGGSRLLRGFDEQQIFASAYTILTTEIRLLLGRDAYLYGFGDFGWVDARNRSQPDLPFDYPIGFGAGVNFSTPAGIFGLSLALGRRSGEILDLNAPKVHFGYLSVF